MKATLALAVATAATLALGELFARWAVEANVAAALLSPQGVDLSALPIAAGYVLARLGGAALACFTFAFGAARAARWTLERLSARRASRARTRAR